MFVLDPRLERDSSFIVDLPLCQVRLMDDAQYPWLVLVPRRAGVREIFELDPVERQQLLDESCRVAERMVAMLSPTKMNVAALGNIVSQLHVHHVARFEGDAAWPAPVWGKHPTTPYAEPEREALITRFLEALSPR